MPILLSPSSRSPSASTSAQTRAVIDPTVRHAMRINSVIALFEDWVASHVMVSSKSRGCAAPCLAHGTCATTTPCSGHGTRGVSASRKAGTVPTSSAPPSPTPARVVASAPAPAHPAPATSSADRADVGHQRLIVVVELDPFDDRLVDAQQGAPYPGVAHAVLRSSVADPRQARNLSGDGVFAIQPRCRGPRERQESRISKGCQHLGPSGS